MKVGLCSFEFCVKKDNKIVTDKKKFFESKKETVNEPTTGISREQATIKEIPITKYNQMKAEL